MQDNTLNKSNFSTHKSLVTRPAFLIVILFFLVVKLLLSLFWPAPQRPLASDLSQENILNAVNKERSLRNLVLLNTNGKLTNAAQSKSEDMQSRRYFAHVDPDGRYIWDKIVAAGYTPYIQLGENLAIEFYDTDSLMSAWMNSPTHRANIIQEGFKDQGMGLTFGNTQNGQYHSAVTNTFGAQNKPKPQPQPEPSPVVPTKPVIAQKVTPPKVKSVAKPAPTTPAPTAPAPTTPILPTKETPAPEITKFPPITPRQEETLVANEPNFTLQQTTHSSASSSAPATPTLKENLSDLVDQTQSSSPNDYNANRYLILICGVALLLLMLSDIKAVVEKKIGSLDKKINNLVLLLISMIIIAFMYWL